MGVKYFSPRYARSLPCQWSHITEQMKEIEDNMDKLEMHLNLLKAKDIETAAEAASHEEKL